jgi:hypothetical protein
MARKRTDLKDWRCVQAATAISLHRRCAALCTFFSCERAFPSHPSSALAILTTTGRDDTRSHPG